jgi:MORN repeat
MRQGRGKIIFSDGGVYTGGWNKNKKHGRGEESFVNDSFLVYYNSGYREQVLSKTDSKNRRDPLIDNSVKTKMSVSPKASTNRNQSLAGFDDQIKALGQSDKLKKNKKDKKKG